MVRGHFPRSPRPSQVVMTMKVVTVVNPGVLRGIFFKAQQVCFELIDMPHLEKTEQAPARQIICEQARGDMDKVKQVVTALANVELVTGGGRPNHIGAAGGCLQSQFFVCFCVCAAFILS